jgi:hypothetical protein
MEKTEQHLRDADEKRAVQLLFARRLDFYAPKAKLVIAACLGLLQRADLAMKKRAKTRAKKEGGKGGEEARTRLVKVVAVMSGVELCSVPIHEADQVVNILTRIAKKLGESVALWKQSDLFTGSDCKQIWSYFDDSIHDKLPTLVGDTLQIVSKIPVSVSYKPIAAPDKSIFFGVDRVSFLVNQKVESLESYAMWGSSFSPVEDTGDAADIPISTYTHRCITSKHKARITIDKNWSCLTRGDFAVSFVTMKRNPGTFLHTNIYVRRVDEKTGVLWSGASRLVTSIDFIHTSTEPKLQLFWNGKLTVFTGRELMLFDLNHMCKVGEDANKCDKNGKHGIAPSWVRPEILGTWRGVQTGMDLGFLVLTYRSGKRYEVVDACTGGTVTRVSVRIPYREINFMNSWDMVVYKDRSQRVYVCKARPCKARPCADDKHCQHELCGGTKMTTTSIARIHRMFGVEKTLVHGPRRLIIDGNLVHRLNLTTKNYDLVLRIYLRTTRKSYSMFDDHLQNVDFSPKFLTDNGKTLCLTFKRTTETLSVQYVVSFPLLLGKSYQCTFKHNKYKIVVEDATIGGP